jgi:tetratricopeptide (TPR) repeat protein
MLEEKDPLQKAEIYKKTGICYKKLGDFENARTFLTEANNIYPNLSSVLAELADCYSLCGEDKFGKVLYREAFFADPDSIDLDFLDSELIKCLIEKTKSKGYSGKALQYWIPVYGVLCGVFNIKRELTSQEVARLKKDLYAMENEIKDPSCNNEILVPRMLNCYFWLMDHYYLAKENQAKINEVLLRIKLLDSAVYEIVK